MSRLHPSTFIIHPSLVALVLLGTLSASGCARVQPTLTAGFAPAIPLPNAFIETALWRQGKPLIVDVRQVGTGEIKEVELRAIHDGRVLSLLAGWPDQSQTFMRHAWVWDDAADEFRLREYLNDRFQVIWPISNGADLDLFGGRPGVYDVWQWQAGWTNASGYADDARLIVERHPGPARPDSVEGTLYPAPRGKGFIEHRWEPDSGRPGTILSQRPIRPGPRSIQNAAMADPNAGGSAADVRAMGLYGKSYRQPNTFFHGGGERTPGYWFGDPGDEERPGSWFVEFYRRLMTAYPEEDYQIEGRGPHRFIIGVIDDEYGAQPFYSRPIRLRLARTP